MDAIPSISLVSILLWTYGNTARGPVLACAWACAWAYVCASARAWASASAWACA